MDILGSIDWSLLSEVSFKIFVAFILSGMIGLEREVVRRPAGIKTHTLICISATLIMSLGIYMNELFPETASDPTRLPAQILAGIGFVGAGTILSNGMTVKGVTTAASLLATTCIGLAVGAGFYEGAVIATIFVFLILCFGIPTQRIVSKTFKKTVIAVTSKNVTGTLGRVQEILENSGLEVFHIKQRRNYKDKSVTIKYKVNYDGNMSKSELFKQLKSIEGVTEVDFAKRISD